MIRARPIRRLCRPRVHHRHRSEAGFTLIELLVALTLLGLISVVLFGGLRFGTRAWVVGNLRAEQLAQVQAVQALLRRRIAQALPPGSEGAEDAGVAGPETRRAIFSGQPDVLRFLAAVPSRAGVGGIYAFELAAIEDGAPGRAPGGGGVRLEFTWRLHRADDEAERGELPEAGLPGLIAIEAEFPEGDVRSWPVLQVAPKLGGMRPAG